MSIALSVKNFQFVKTLSENQGQIYVVGGSVRDTFLKRDIKDLDIIVTKIPMNDLIRLLRRCGQTNLVGKSFGVIKFFPHEDHEFEIDIALPRKEQSTGVGHKDFDVAYDENLSIEEDLKRRDFTINAIAQNLITGDVIDPANGRLDIHNKLIRIVFENSFQEDPLRLLRAVQFASRLNFTIESNTLESMKTFAPLIESVAKERIIIEIQKLFTSKKPSVGFDLMKDSGLLHFIFPDIENMLGVLQPKKENEDVYTHTMKVLNAARSAEELEKKGDLNIMFAALFHDAGKPITKKVNDTTNAVTFFNHQVVSAGIARRWMRENKITTIGVNPKHVYHLIRHHMFETKHFENNDKALRRFVSKVGKDNIFDLLDLRLSDKKGGRFPDRVYKMLQLRENIHNEINKAPPFTAKDLVLNGFDIMNLGYEPGPVIGKIQKFLIEKVLDQPELNTKESLTNLIEENKESFTTVSK